MHSLRHRRFTSISMAAVMFVTQVVAAQMAAAQTAATQSALPASATAVSVGSGGADTLTLRQAVEQALNNNPDLAALRLTLERVRGERASAAFFPSLPELEYSAKDDRRYGNQGLSISGWALSQEIEVAGQGLMRGQVATHLTDKADADVKGYLAALTGEVRVRYARLAGLQAKVRLMAQLAGFAKDILGAAQANFSKGRISELENATAHIEAARTVAEFAQAQSAVWESAYQFNRLLGREETSGVAAILDTAVSVLTTNELPVNDLTVYGASLRTPLNQSGAIETALARRQEVRAAVSAEAAAAQAATLSYLKLVPTVKASLTFDSDNTIFPNESTTRFLGFRLGVSVPLPVPFLFNYGQGDIQQREAERRLASLQLTARRREIAGQVSLALRRLDNARASLVLFNAVRPAVERSLALFAKAYQTGQLDLNTLLVQKDRLLRSEQTYLDVLTDYHAAQAEADAALGRLPDELNQYRPSSEEKR